MFLPAPQPSRAPEVFSRMRVMFTDRADSGAAQPHEPCETIADWARYIALRDAWARLHPQASCAEYGAAVRAIAGECGVA